MRKVRWRPVERRVSSFLAKPVSIRNAMAVIVSAMTVSVVLGGVVAWVFDRVDFPTLGSGLWWSLQTVTTVGYGDVVPTTTVGRVVGAVIMLESIAFVSILTAAITSSFVERQRQRRPGTVSRFDELYERLDRIEAAIRSLDQR
jgi:voltage-gated potassium channel